MTHKLARHILLAALLFAIAIGAAVADPGPGITKDDLREIMPLREVKAGMHGYGLTVFKGTKIEKFDVDVLGILRKMNNGRDLILVRMSGGPITTRGANIIAGMSGSPVYINGRIIGAVSYGNQFPKEPLGMVTPIEDMLESLDPNLPSEPSGLSSTAQYAKLDKPVQTDGRTYTGVSIDNGNGASESSSPAGILTMRPLMTPLMVSGFSGKNLSKLNEIMKPFGMTAMAGPGAGSEHAKVDLVPGAAVGVSLARGDVDITGVGTLTYRRGNKVIAFGHPMLGIGAVDAAMATAYVHDIFPSVMVSTKIASPMDVVGRISQDRPFSVGGEIGSMPHMIPVTISLRDTETKRTKVLHVKVINHPLLAPKLIAMVCSQGVGEIHPTPGDAMARVSFGVDADQIGEIKRQNEVFDPIQIGDAATEDLQDLLMLLSSNRFYPLDVKSVKLSVDINSGHNTANIERIFLDESKYRPGDTMKVGVVLRPYKQEAVTKTLSVKIPEYVPSGRLTVQVHGGGSPAGGQMAVLQSGQSQGAGIKIIPTTSGSGTADNIHQLIKKYLETEKNNDLVGRLILGSALNVRGEKLSRLPSTIANVMKSAESTGLKQEKDDVKTVLPTDYIISGSQTLSVTVEREDHSEKKAPSRPGSPSSPSAEPPSGSHSSGSVTVIDEDFDQDFSTRNSADRSSTSLKPVYSSVEPVSTTTEPAATASHPIVPPKGVMFTVGIPVPPGSLPHPPRPAQSAPTRSSKSKDEYVGRELTTWKQTTMQDFASGSFSGTAVTTADDVRLAPTLRRVASLDASFVWSVLTDGSGGAYAGTGNKGTIYRIGKDGKAKELFDTKELAVQSLAKDSSGDLYAGTSPDGKVYKITPDGKGKVVLDADEKYILAVACAGNGNVYAGAGDSGNIYRISPDGKTAVFAALPESQVLSLAVDSKNNVYAGTGTHGVVYRISPEGQIRVLYDASQDSITALAVDGSESVYAGTDGKGALYRIEADGAAKAVYTKFGAPVLSLAPVKGGDVYAASGDSIYRVSPDDTVYNLDAGKEQVQFLSVAANSDGTVYAGTSNAGSVFSSAAAAASAVYESPVHDTKLSSKWGPISWTAKLPSGSAVRMQTRTGDVTDPDATWSSWSSSYEPADGARILSPAGRYIQYRARLIPGNGGVSPELKDVTISYLPANQTPTVKITVPQGGEHWSKTQTVKWAGSDPDKDTLTYDIFYSSDNGATWKPLDRRVKSGDNKEARPSDGKKDDVKKDSSSSEARTNSKPDTGQSKAVLKAELDRHPEIPVAVKGKILAEASDNAKNAKETEAKKDEKTSVKEENVADKKETSAPSSKQTSYSWDTTKIPDGRYVIKVVASDRTSNAVGYLTGEAVSDPFVIVNQPPKLFLFKRSMKVEKDRTVHLEGYTFQNSVRIAGAQYRVDTGDWMAAAPDDGMYDGKTESFTVVTLPLSRGMHTVEVKVFDAAGNSNSAKAQVTVP